MILKVFLRTFWMLFWRSYLVFSALGLSLNNPMVLYGPFGVIIFSFVGSFIICVVLGIEIYTFPIIRMLRGLPFYDHIKNRNRRKTKSKSKSKRAKLKTREQFKYTHGIQKRATQRGYLTGYENNVIENIPLPSSNSMFGKPGAGLTEAVDKFGQDAVKMGQKGELNFSKILSITDINGLKCDQSESMSLLNQLYSFWSVSIPSNGQKNYNTDVDCILLKDKRMMLVDIKYYSDGNVMYYGDNNLLYTVDKNTGNWVGKPKKISHNMEMAVDRFKKAFPFYTIEAMVVLVPTNMGIGEMSGYPYRPKCSNGIDLYTIDTGLLHIIDFFKSRHRVGSTNLKDVTKLKRLLRGNYS